MLSLVCVLVVTVKYFFQLTALMSKVQTPAAYQCAMASKLKM